MSVKRQTFDWLVVEAFMMEELRFVWGGSGAQYVMTSGTTEMLLWCVDNLATMEVSLSHQMQLKLYLMLCYYNAAAYALREYGGHLKFHLDDVSCSGNETKLVDCFHSGVGNHNCRTGIDEAAVICTGECSNNYI